MFPLPGGTRWLLVIVAALSALLLSLPAQAPPYKPPPPINRPPKPPPNDQTGRDHELIKPPTGSTDSTTEPVRRTLSLGARYALETATTSRMEPLSAEFPDVKIKLANDPRFDREILAYGHDTLLTDLTAKVDIGQIQFISLVGELTTREQVDKRIPRSARTATELSGRLERPPPATRVELVALLRPLAGRTVVIMSHIEKGKGTEDGKAWFEFESDRGKVSTSVEDLMSAAREAKVDLLAAGCYSSDVASVGTTKVVNSLDVVDAFGKLFAKGGTLTNGAFYQAIAGPKFPIAIDLVAYEHFGRIDRVTPDGQDAGVLYRSRPSGVANQQNPGSVDDQDVERLKRTVEETLRRPSPPPSPLADPRTLVRQVATFFNAVWFLVLFAYRAGHASSGDAAFGWAVGLFMLAFGTTALGASDLRWGALLLGVAALVALYLRYENWSRFAHVMAASYAIIWLPVCVSWFVWP